MLKVSVVRVGQVVTSAEGYGFNITNEHARPLLSITYRTEAEAVTARQVMERELANVLEVTAHG